MDNYQRATFPGKTVYLRINNNPSDETSEAATYGFQVTVTGGTGGTSDIEIEPPPDVIALSEKDIGLVSTTLRSGAHSFSVSHTWVQKRMEQENITDPYDVFRGDAVIGFFYDKRLFSIATIRPVHMHGETISWFILADMLEPPENC